MSGKILITYATSAGSTAGVAEAIGQTLRQGGAEVDVFPMSTVRDITPYRAVVAGSAIHAGAWLPEAMAFLMANQAALAQKPFAAFAVCMTMALNKGQYRQQVAAWMQPVREWVKPFSEEYFAGALDIGKLPSLADRLKFRLSVLLGVWSEGDHRDWSSIRAWASSLSAQLQAPTS